MATQLSTTENIESSEAMSGKRPDVVTAEEPIQVQLTISCSTPDDFIKLLENSSSLSRITGELLLNIDSEEAAMRTSKDIKSLCMLEDFGPCDLYTQFFDYLKLLVHAGEDEIEEIVETTGAKSFKQIHSRGDNIVRTYVLRFDSKEVSKKALSASIIIGGKPHKLLPIKIRRGQREEYKAGKAMEEVYQLTVGVRKSDTSKLIKLFEAASSSCKIEGKLYLYVEFEKHTTRISNNDLNMEPPTNKLTVFAQTNETDEILYETQAEEMKKLPGQKSHRGLYTLTFASKSEAEEAIARGLKISGVERTLQYDGDPEEEEQLNKEADMKKYYHDVLTFVRSNSPKEFIEMLENCPAVEISGKLYVHCNSEEDAIETSKRMKSLDMPEYFAPSLVKGYFVDKLALSVLTNEFEKTEIKAATQAEKIIKLGDHEQCEGMYMLLFQNQKRLQAALDRGLTLDGKERLLWYLNILDPSDIISRCQADTLYQVRVRVRSNKNNVIKFLEKASTACKMEGNITLFFDVIEEGLQFSRNVSTTEDEESKFKLVTASQAGLLTLKVYAYPTEQESLLEQTQPMSFEELEKPKQAKRGKSLFLLTYASEEAAKQAIDRGVQIDGKKRTISYNALSVNIPPAKKMKSNFDEENSGEEQQDGTE